LIHLQVTSKVLQKADTWIKFPTSPQEILQAKEIWMTKFRMPCVIGAIDCTHVRISKPKENGDEYINRKGYPSFNVQATCNANEEFTSVDANWPGSVHDSRIFKNSTVGNFLKNRTQSTVLIGDSGYGIAPWIITPFENPTTDAQINFNAVYAKERVIIERCFGQLKRRFPILHYKVRVALPKISGIIVCCCILHNIGKYLKDNNDFSEYESPPENCNPEHRNNTTVVLSDARTRALGQQLRDQIVQILISNH